MQRPLGNDTHPHRQQHRARERIPNEVSTGAPLAPRLRPGGQLLEVFLEYPLQSHELLYAEDLPGAADLPIYLAVRQYARRGAVAAEMPAPHRLAHVDYEAAPNMARNALLNLFQHRALARHELLGWLGGLWCPFCSADHCWANSGVMTGGFKNQSDGSLAGNIF